MIPSIDDMVGALYASLERHGLLDRTVILFSSDNGFLLGEHGLARKGLAYEPSIRVPLLMRLPGQASAGARVREQALNVDIPATLLSLAGLSPQDGADGRPLDALVRELPDDWRDDWLYVAPYPPGGSPPLLAVRTDSRKYVRYENGEEELFDLAADPDERLNLASKQAARETLAEMRNRLARLVKERRLAKGWWSSSPGEGGSDR